MSELLIKIDGEGSVKAIETTDIKKATENLNKRIQANIDEDIGGYDKTTIELKCKDFHIIENRIDIDKKFKKTNDIRKFLIKYWQGTYDYVNSLKEEERKYLPKLEDLTIKILYLKNNIFYDYLTSTYEEIRQLTEEYEKLNNILSLSLECGTIQTRDLLDIENDFLYKIIDSIKDDNLNLTWDNIYLKAFEFIKTEISEELTLEIQNVKINDESTKDFLKALRDNIDNDITMFLNGSGDTHFYITETAYKSYQQLNDYINIDEYIERIGYNWEFSI